MIDIDLYYFYCLASDVRKLSLPVENSKLSEHFSGLNRARSALRQYLESDFSSLTPRVNERAEQLIDQINGSLPPDKPFEERTIDFNEAWGFRIALRDFEISLADAYKSLFIVCVQDQRALSAHTLVQRIERCFPEECWKIIEDTAKREFEEAGKCLALERYTGAGFHSMRGVELVIRQCIVTITGSLPKKRDWGHYIEILKENNVNPKLVASIETMRTVDRNPLIHPEDWLDIDDAIAIFTNSQTAVARLVAEIKKKNPQKGES